MAAETQVLVDDLYRPYRPKRRTRATIAKEKGLESLAVLISLQNSKEPLEKEAEKYVSEEKGVKNVQEAIDGAKDILAENISDEADYRKRIRDLTFKKGTLVSAAKDEKTESVYEMYYDFTEAVSKVAGHRVLALNRGEKEKFLSVKIEAPEEEILRYLEKKVIRRDNPYTTPVLKEVVADSYQRLIAPAIERELRNELTEKAEDGAILVFGKNLEQLLMQPPIVGQVVLGWDPAFRTGCKLAVVDPTGKVIGTTVIYPTAPTTPKKIQAAKDLLKKIIPKYHISLISLGNGTASRESEQFIVELLKEIPEKVQYVIVNEAGASVYSASKLATEEFPKFDVGQRSATSIARRLQDPLAELVKIDPQSIGVGQYQHDMNQKKLGEALGGVVEDCVNKVGVDLYPTAPTTPKKIQAAKDLLKKIIPKYHISLISLGNGTASRESEQFIVELLKEIPEKVQYVIVNEAGASVYSASKLATEEFPKFDVGQRSATSIARRLQDPLAELVKIDPQSIGVGQYQHDMNQKKLGEALGGVVEDCVNKVGVDLNTASAPLLSYISGISGTLAKNIVAYREENGKFENRKELLKVPKLGPKAFEQCAGFMRIQGGTNPLDGTSVHPESYEAAGKLLEKQGFKPEDIAGGKLAGLSLTIKDYKKLAEELGIGEITLRDIVKELEKPARDPRDEMPKPILRTDVLDMKDLKEGMILKGTVRNVIDFGVFVDIGVHQDGLVHISQITDRFIKHPLEAVSVGDVVDVKVMSVDLQKKRIQLTMRGIQ